MINPVELSFVEWLTEQQHGEQKDVLLARRYHDGNHDVFLTERMEEFLGIAGAKTRKPAFRLNVVRAVVQAVAERLIVEGFSHPTKEAAGWAWQLWQQNRMDAGQVEIHEGALRDGASYVLVDWHAAEMRPRFIPHPRYTDPQAGGDGFGCEVLYENGDPSYPALHATKRWNEDYSERDERGQDRIVSRPRLTRYYPDRIEKYAFDVRNQRWQALQDEGDPGWPIPWLGSDGLPLGIPVIEFRNAASRPEAQDAIPVQDSINKTFIDLIASADLTAFRIYKAFGFYPTTDGNAPNSDNSNALHLAPAMIVGSQNPDASFDAIEGADLGPLGDLVMRQLLWLAMVTSTPVTRFQITGQVAAEGTLKQQETALLAKIALRQTLFGNGWEDVMHIARRMQNVFGTERVAEDGLFTTLWRRAEMRSDAEVAQRVEAKIKARVPREQIWRDEFNYSEADIARMKQSEEYRAAISLLRLGLQGPDEQEQGQDGEP
jgi:hypothetical protein